jgi:Peptidase family C25
MRLPTDACQQYDRRGVAVDRVYGKHPGSNPQRFNDGTSLPASLKKPAFAWNGTGAQVSAGWNDGRFMVVHRDHGWSDGWGTPGFGTGDVNALTNGARLPVVTEHQLLERRVRLRRDIVHGRLARAGQRRLGRRVR